MKRALVAVLFLAWAPSAWAHHATAVAFDIEKPQTLSGIITRVEWQNPHVLLHVNSPGWTIELPSANNCIRLGLDRDSLRVGDSISVTAFPSRTTAGILSLSEATLASGRSVVLDQAGLVGHHSFADIFDANDRRTLSGSVLDVDLNADRTLLFLDVKGETWQIELPRAGLLPKNGWPQNGTRRGEVLTVTGFAGKNAERNLNATEVLFPDGSKWSEK